MSEPGDHMPDREALAAEYVLGTLPHADRLAAEALIDNDAGFRALVEDWRDRLAPLNEGYPEVPPPPALLRRIEDRLFPVAELPRRRGWLWGALAGFAAVAIAAVVVTTVLGPTPPPLIATLTGEGQPLVVAAHFDEAMGALTVERTAGPAAGTGKDYELWLIPEGQAPVAIGLVRDGPLTIPVTALPKGTTLAITLEPEGGSPGPGPTGPLLVAALIGG